MLKLVFSEPYNWENDSGVIQILVFGSQGAKEHFDKAVADPNVQKTAEGFPYENNHGALFKVRAVKNSNGNWDCVIRCGVDAQLIYERKLNTADSTDALVYGITKLRHCLDISFEEQVQKLRAYE
jgi:hypothetical protein